MEGVKSFTKYIKSTYEKIKFLTFFILTRGVVAPDGLHFTSPLFLSRSSEQLPGLSLDVLIDILTRLPVKTLIRFKCVSKLFSTLISSKYFINTHLNISSKNSDSTRVILSSYDPRVDFKSFSLHLLLSSVPENAQELDNPFKDTGLGVLPVGSLNGLVCVLVEKNLFLWNPSTKVSKKLPCMGSEQCEHETTYGFGFDECNDDYKVVKIFGLVSQDKGCKSVHVYSLRDDSWHKTADFPYDAMLLGAGIYMNCSLHWLVGNFSTKIVALNLSSEKYSEIQHPNYGNNYSETYLLLGVLQGCLCVLADFTRDRSDLWVMNKYRIRDSWVKLCSIPYLFDPQDLWYSFPSWISIYSDLLLKIGEDLVLYNSSDETFRLPAIPRLDNYPVYGVTYVESLVLPIVACTGNESEKRNET